MHEIQMALKIAALVAIAYLAIFGRRYGWD